MEAINGGELVTSTEKKTLIDNVTHFHSYESANGIKAEETGDVKNKGSDNAIQAVQGSYSYTSPEGQLVEISYTADENGFQAQGDSLPTPVPLPEEYLKALAEFEAAYATGRFKNIYDRHIS